MGHFPPFHLFAMCLGKPFILDTQFLWHVQPFFASNFALNIRNNQPFVCYCNRKTPKRQYSDKKVTKRCPRRALRNKHSMDNVELMSPQLIYQQVYQLCARGKLIKRPGHRHVNYFTPLRSIRQRSGFRMHHKTKHRRQPL